MASDRMRQRRGRRTGRVVGALWVFIPFLNPPPLPPNAPPVFTSDEAATVPENAAGVIHQVSAQDSDGRLVMLSLDGGGDAGHFHFDRWTGELRFRTPPDFERPADADGDNVYTVTVRASDGRDAAVQALSIAVEDVVDTVAVRRVGQGFAEPLFVTGLPDGSGRVVVLEKGGRARLLNPETGAIDSVDFLDVSAEIATVGEQGLLGLAFSPAFATDGTVYVNLINLDGDSEIRRYRTYSGVPDQADPSTMELILRIGQPRANHNGGWIGFDDAGRLIMAVGDGGGRGDPENRAQDPFQLLGKVLRLDVSGADAYPDNPDRNYAIPPDNPYADQGGPEEGEPAAQPEIWAVGLRNPWRCSIDPDTGDLLIGDVGQNALEEINRLSADMAYPNFGWSVREGTEAYKGEDDDAFTPPVLEITRSMTAGQPDGPFQGRSVTGGYVYRGPVEAHQGDYIFADFRSDNLWAIPAASLVNGATLPATAAENINAEFAPDAGTLTLITSFGTDTGGHLYIVSYLGDIFRMEAE